MIFLQVDHDMTTAENEIPEWLTADDDYDPPADRENFITKTMLKLVGVLSNAREDGRIRAGGASPAVKIIYILYFIVLTAVSANAFFLYCMLAFCLARYCFLPAKYLGRILRSAAAAALLSMLILLPAVFLGQPSAMLTVSLKVFLSVSMLTFLSVTTPWNRLTSALRVFRVPNIFIFTFDITLKYIVILGDMCVNILTAMKLRSVGKNKDKSGSLSGVLGNVFLRSREMAEEMYGAMQCRGFEGEYYSMKKKLFAGRDAGYVLMMAAVTALFCFLQAA